MTLLSEIFLEIYYLNGFFKIYYVVFFFNKLIYISIGFKSLFFAVMKNF